MENADREGALVERVVDLVLRGEAPDLERLLSGEPEVSPATRAKLEQIVATFGREAGTGAARKMEQALPFERLGPYRLIEPFGRGGMGTVYLAEHEFLRRRVALKLIRPELALSEVTRERFRREAMSVAKLRHANIVTVYDAGDDHGVAYLAMELVEGQGLDALLAEAAPAPLALETSVRLARDVARALQCAHEAGVVHRDVKPSNVRITPEGKAMLLDFGLALGTEFATLTQAGQFRGTPTYASPEQVAAENVEIDARTDVYSLGATLYECLTGEPPFHGATTQQLFHQILVREPDPPHRRNAGVDPELERILARSLAKKREARFADAGAMADALEDWLARACAPSTVHPARPSSRRVVLFGFLALGATGAGWFALRRGSPRREERVMLRSTLLFGAPDLPFGRRLEGWAKPLGSGAFGDDEEGPGVIGQCPSGASALPRSLPDGELGVTGRFESIPVYDPESDSETPTAAAGVGLEWSEGRGYALLVRASSGGPLRAEVHEIERGEDVPWRSVRTLGAGVDGDFGVGTGLAFALRLAREQLEISFGAQLAGGEHRVTAPLDGRSGARRLLLLVERGSARFREFVLEAP